MVFFLTLDQVLNIGLISFIMVKAIFPGSFDPLTYGHLNVIERARTIFNEVHVVVAVNSEKNYLFTETERFEMIEEMISSSVVPLTK